MTLKQLLAKSALAAGVGLAAIGLSSGVAGAQPTPTPQQPVTTTPIPPPVPPVPEVPGSAAAAANSADPTDPADPEP